MAKRPALKVGDVVRLSKKGLRIHARHKVLYDTMVVHKISSTDSTDGHCKVVCTYFKANKAHRATFKRRELWSTGFNALGGQSQVATAPNINVNRYVPPSSYDVPNIVKPVAKTNDGKTHCMSCSQPTIFVPGFGQSGYNLCKNKSCKMYDT